VNGSDLYHRLTRIETQFEERGKARDEKLDSIEQKVDQLYQAFVQGQGSAKANKFWIGAIGGIAGAFGGFLVKILPLTSSLPK